MGTLSVIVKTNAIVSVCLIMFSFVVYSSFYISLFIYIYIYIFVYISFYIALFIYLFLYWSHENYGIDIMDSVNFCGPTRCAGL